MFSPGGGVVALFACACVMSIVAYADTRSWTGAGDGMTFGQPANWQDGVAPSAGCRVSIPSDATVKVGTAADASLLESLDGADLDGTLEIADFAAEVTLPATFSLSGSGAFRALSISKIALHGDNSDYTGSFFTSNTIVDVRNNRAFGVSCPVTHYVTTQNKILFVNAGGIYDNPVTLYQVSASNPYFSYQTSANITNRGDFILYSPRGDNYCNRFAGDANKRLVFTGDVTVKSGFLDCTGAVYLDGTASTVASRWIMCDSGNLYVGRTITPSDLAEFRPSGGGSLVFTAVNALNGAKVRPNGATPTIDLNGLDQTIGNLQDTSTDGRARIHSASDATLTMTGVADSNRYGGYFSGAVSFTFDSAGNTLTLTNNPSYPSTTTGSLTAKAGTIAIGKGAAFTALGRMILDGGTLSVAKGAFVNTAVRLAVTSAGGTLALADDVELVVATARVNGGFAAADTYTAADPGPFAGILSGGGTLRVVSEMEPIDDSPIYVWTGGTDTSLSTGANWQGGKAPTFGGTETIVFKENNGTANVSGAIKAYALKFDGAGTFALTGDSGARIDVLYGGVTVTNSASSDAFAVTVAPSLRMLTDQTWTVPAGDTLTLSSELKAAPPLTAANALTGRGNGQLHLLADNSAFLPQFDFKDRFSVRTTNGKGLGSPTRSVTCRVLPYFYGGKALTNDVPLTVYDSTYNNDYDHISASGTPLVQRGLVTFANTVARTCYIAFGDEGELLGGITEPAAIGNSFWIRSMTRGKTVMIAGEPISARFATATVDQVGAFALGGTGSANRYLLIRIARTFLECLADDVMNPNATLAFGQKDNPSGNRSPFGMSYGVLDLNGHCQHVQGMAISGRIDGVGYAHVTSDVPASVVAVGVQTNENLMAKFLGAAGFTLDASGAITAFSNAVSTTTGDLCISNGVLRLDSGYVWGGSNTVTVAGGALEVTQGAASGAFGGNTTRTKMFLSGSGVLNLPSGATVTVQKLCVDGKEAPSGAYCGADGAASKLYAAHFGAGTGVLRVLKSDAGGCVITFR